MDGSGELFAAFIAALGDAAEALVVAYPPGEALDYEGLVRFAGARLPRDQPYVLLGESFSGPVAIALAATQPPGLAGLILCCTFARNPTPVFKLFKRGLGLLPISATFTGLVSPFLLGTGSSSALRASLRSVLERVSAAVMRVRMRAVLDVDYSAQMRAVTVPILYLQAEHDCVVFAGSARHLKTLQPRMEIARLSGPHLLLQSAPSGAATLVARFLRALPGPQGMSTVPD